MAGGVCCFFITSSAHSSIYGSPMRAACGSPSPSRRAAGVGWFFGIGRIGSFLAPAVVGFMLHWGAGAYVLHTFALTFLIASIALWFVGVETRGRTLEEITGQTARA